MLSKVARDRMTKHIERLAQMLGLSGAPELAAYLDKAPLDLFVVLADIAKHKRRTAPAAYRPHVDAVVAARGKKKKRAALVHAVSTHGAGFLDWLKSAASKVVDVGKAGIDVAKGFMGFAKKPEEKKEYKGQEGLDRFRSDVKRNESSLASMFTGTFG